MGQLKTALNNYIKTFFITRFDKDCILEATTFGTRKFNCANNVEIWRTTQYGREEKSLGAFLFLLKEDDVVWDIGASVGLYTIYSSELVKEVISFEPDPEIYSRLQANIALNNLKNVSTNQIGIGDKDTSMELSSNGVKGNSPTLIKDLNRHTGSISVAVRSVDSLIKSGSPSPTVIKMDIEGAEGIAIKGALDLLKGEQKPRLIFVELHPQFLSKSEPDEITQILKESGYKILNTLNRDKEYHLIATT
jgi:FkbM family methyltransferase